jgi:uncharacterized protein (DUF58 family)
MVPTPRCAILVAASVPLGFILVSAIPDAALACLYLPFFALALCIYDFLASPGAKSMTLSFDCPQILYVGTSAPISLELMTLEPKKGALKVRALLSLSGKISLCEPITITLDPAKGKGEFSLTPTLRGKVFLNGVFLAWRGPAGFLELRKKIDINKTIDVLQNINGIHEEALKYFSKDAQLGVKILRYKGMGSEFENLTEYALGMDNRFIDWKRSARFRKLLAKEFRLERNNQIILGFDTGRLMLEPIGSAPRLDHFIRAALMLGWISLRSGDLVGSCGFDLTFRHYLAPGRTPSFFLKLQRFTASLDYSAAETNFTLCLSELSAKLHQRALVVLFTEFGDSVAASLLIECLEQISRKHLVVFVSTPDPLTLNLTEEKPSSFQSMAESVIADGFKKERAIVLERMSRLGVFCIDLPPQALGGSLINRYLTIKERGLL